MCTKHPTYLLMNESFQNKKRKSQKQIAYLDERIYVINVGDQTKTCRFQIVDFKARECYDFPRISIKETETNVKEVCDVNSKLEKYFKKYFSSFLSDFQSKKKQAINFYKSCKTIFYCNHDKHRDFVIKIDTEQMEMGYTDFSINYYSNNKQE